MKFGVREVADITFKAKSNLTLGKETFEAGEPVIFFDSAKTSTMESSAATVYAQGGKGNARLLAWEGDKTATLPGSMYVEEKEYPEINEGTKIAIIK